MSEKEIRTENVEKGSLVETNGPPHAEALSGLENFVRDSSKDSDVLAFLGNLTIEDNGSNVQKETQSASTESRSRVEHKITNEHDRPRFNNSPPSKDKDSWHRNGHEQKGSVDAIQNKTREATRPEQNSTLQSKDFSHRARIEELETNVEKRAHTTEKDGLMEISKDTDGKIVKISDGMTQTDTYFIGPNGDAVTVLKDGEGKPIARFEPANPEEKKEARIVLPDGKEIPVSELPQSVRDAMDFIKGQRDACAAEANKPAAPWTFFETPKAFDQKNAVPGTIAGMTKLMQAMNEANLPPAAKLALMGHSFADLYGNGVSLLPKTGSAPPSWEAWVKSAGQAVNDSQESFADSIRETVGPYINGLKSAAGEAAQTKDRFEEMGRLLEQINSRRRH